MCGVLPVVTGWKELDCLTEFCKKKVMLIGCLVVKAIKTVGRSWVGGFWTRRRIHKEPVVVFVRLDQSANTRPDCCEKFSQQICRLATYLLPSMVA